MPRKNSNERKRNPLDERIALLDKGYKHGNLYGFFDASDVKEKKKQKEKNQKKIPQKSRYELTLMMFQYHCYEMILNINNIPLEYYISANKYGVDLNNNLDLDDKFMNLSQLRWGEESDPDGLDFHGKFATLILFKVIRKSHSLTKRMFELADIDEKRYRTYNRILDSWMKQVDGFVMTYLSNDLEYTPFLLKINHIIETGWTGDEKTPVNLAEVIHETEAMMLDNEEPGIVANNATKIAFILMTYSPKVKKCPDYDEYLSYKDDTRVLNQVAGLGYAILKYRMKHKDEKMPILYSCFEEAQPKIYSRFSSVNEDAPEITTGLISLEYSKLFYTDKVRMNKLVDRLM
jgi:hypothetical protein